MKLSPTMGAVARTHNHREAKRLGEIEAFQGARAAAATPEDLNRVLLMGCFRLAAFDGRRQANRRIREARREADLLKRDLSRGHNTARVKRAIHRAIRATETP
jgi:hypothetical protein